MSTTQISGVSKEMQECIDNCLSCHLMCERTAMHCLQMGGEHASREHQATIRDCSQLCALCADLMVRESPIHSASCTNCAMACERCDQECRRLANGDELMLKCAEICRRCAISCRIMAGSGASAAKRYIS